MPSAFSSLADPSFADGDDADLLFRRGTVRIAHFSALTVAAILSLWSSFRHTALVTPVDPDFRAVAIGFGVFWGVLVASVEREAWQLGIGIGRRAPPRGLSAVAAMAVIVVLSGAGGDFLAARLWEWRAFAGVHATIADREFTVVSRDHGRHSSSVVLDQAGRQVSVNCSYGFYHAVRDGDRLMLPVEMGRAGVERVTLPDQRG